jgi:hypothetical protein
MRWRIVIFLLLIALLLLGATGHFFLGCWRPSHSNVTEAGTGYEADYEPATLPEVLASAREALDNIQQNVHDYSAVIIKQERIGSALVKTAMFAKIREKPFGAYLNVLDRSDEDIKGREVIYVEGGNDGKLLAHTPGLLSGRLPVLHLDPNGFLAMRGERHPITEIGLANLCRQLIARGEAAGDPAKVNVKRYLHARINSRPCTLLEVMYPCDEKKNWGYLARIFVDNQWRFPTRVEVYELPRDDKHVPRLLEEYTYLDVKLNNGYTDADFDPKNRQYKFP